MRLLGITWDVVRRSVLVAVLAAVVAVVAVVGAAAAEQRAAVGAVTLKTPGGKALPGR